MKTTAKNIKHALKNMKSTPQTSNNRCKTLEKHLTKGWG